MKKKNLFLVIGIVLLFVIVGTFLYFRFREVDKPISEIEHRITIRTEDKLIKAHTGSFCYKYACIDKIGFEDFDYDVIPSYHGNKLYIENLDGVIYAVKLFNYGIREFTDTKVEFTDEYVITPSVSGLFVFEINAIYQGKNIQYYFMSEISKINSEDIKLDIKIKESTLSNTGLTMVINNTSGKDLEYGNPYSIEKYENGYWKSVTPINEIAFTLPAYSLNKNASIELSIDWEYGYGKLEGKYRIVKSFSYKDKDDYVSFNKYLEFEVK